MDAIGKGRYTLKFNTGSVEVYNITTDEQAADLWSYLHEYLPSIEWKILVLISRRIINV